MCAKIKPKSHMLTIPLYTKSKPRQLFQFPMICNMAHIYHISVKNCPWIGLQKSGALRALMLIQRSIK